MSINVDKYVQLFSRQLTAVKSGKLLGKQIITKCKNLQRDNLRENFKTNSLRHSIEINAMDLNFTEFFQNMGMDVNYDGNIDGAPEVYGMLSFLKSVSTYEFLKRLLYLLSI